MRKAKKLSNKLIAILLSSSMVFAPVIQSVPVYAAEPIIEEESAGTLPDNFATDESVDDNNDSDTPDADNGDSDNQVTDNGDSENSGSENDDSDNSGTENGDFENTGIEDGDTENPEEPNSEDGDSDALGDAEADESLNEEVLPQEDLETVGGRAAGSTTSTISEMTAKGWNESIYAKISGVKAADVKEVKYSGTMNGELDEKDLQYLVRDINSGVRIDVLGLKKGTYTLTVTALSGSTKTVDNITVYEYDRSGYAHFNYEEGVGAYNDDGTLKDNAVVLYVTDENKNDVVLTVGSKTVKGIGNILNSAGKSDNKNADIIKELATAGKPLVVRFIGTVSESGLYSKGEWRASDAGLINGLTDFDSTKNGGGVGDNGHLARIRAGRDITLEGIGTDAVIDGWGFHYMTDGSGPDYGKSFEVRNLTFINTAEDAVGMEGKQDGSVISDAVERCWVHNNEFYCPHIIGPAEDDKAEGDGSVDFKRGEYFTCSYNYFEGCHKTNLVGAGPSVYQYNLTYHHNYYYKCGSRGPLSRNANIHMYNNVYEQQTDYAMDARASAYIFAEYNLFYAASNPHTTSREGGGTIKSYKDSFSSVLWINGKGNIVDDKTTYVENNCQYTALGIQYDRFDLDPDKSYIPNGDYKLQSDFMEMRAVLASQLGVQDDNPKPVAEITPDDYSMVKKSGAVIKQIELPFSAAPGKISQTTYAFKVDVPFNISVKYGATPGILVNDAGENLLEGGGERINLPAGRYMIQSTDFTPTKTGGEIWNDCNIDSIKIEKSDQGGGGDTGIVIKPGDCVLNFEGGKEVDPDNFFDVIGEYTDSMGSAIVGGKEYKYGLMMNSEAKVAFNCSDEATLTLVFDAEYKDKTVKVDGQEQKISADGTIVLSGLSAGSHLITKGDTELGLLYAVVAMVKSYTITLAYNDSSLRDEIEIVAAENKKYETMSELVPSSFIKKDYKLEGLYTDAECKTKVEFPYTVTANVKLYANWIDEFISDDTIYYIKFDTNGGTLANTLAEVSSSQIYKITQKPTKNGYAFAGWYTEREGGQFVDYIDGSKLSESCTIYAHWNSLEKNTLSLDCSKDLDSAVDGTETKDNRTYDTITTRKEINGFTLHVLPGTAGSTKYYMTLKNSDTDNVKVLYTNGVLLQADQDPMLKAIEFETSANSVLIVETALSGNPETGKTYRLVLAKDGAPAGSEQKHNITQGRTKVTEKFNIKEAGKYYLYPEGDKGLVYYSLNVIEQQYTIVYKPGSAAASGDFAGIVAKSDEEITLPAYKAAEGYTFTGWSLNGSTPIDGDKYTVKSEDASADNVITITALYTATEYDIAYDPGEGELPTAELPQKGTTGQTLTLGNCTPANTETHRFVGWSVGDSKPFKNYLVKPTDAVNGTITLKAVYREIPQLYTIKYEVGDGTLPAGKADTEQAYTGDVINLPVCTPPAEKQFLGWNKKGSADYFETYIVKAADADSDKTIIFTAVYGDVGYTYYIVTLNPNGGTLSDGDVGVRKVKKDEQINPGKCTKEGYKFTGWSVNGEIIELPYQVTNDVVLVAQYEEGSSHEGIAIVGLEPTYEFTGAKIIPNIAVVDYDIDDGKVLSPGVDYTVKYTNNNKVSTADKLAKVTVTGRGNYAGKDTQATFKIVEPKATEATLENLKGAKLSKISPVEYTGEAQYPEIELKLKNGMPVKYTYDKEDEVYKVKEGTDQGTAIGAKVSLSNNINKGTATILLTGKNGTNGKPTTIKKTFKITAIDLSKAGNKLTVVADPATYSVKGAVPSKLTVHYKDDNIDKDLINGVDYTVKYSSNKKAGIKAGKISITGKGNYVKKQTSATYDIQALEWSTDDIGNMNPIKAVQVYDGLNAGKVKATVVDKDGNILKPAKYILKVYKKDGDSCTECAKSDKLEENDVIYVEAAAKEGNTDITGTTAKAEFKVGKNIAKAKFVLNKVNNKAFTAQYTGKKIELKATDLKVTIKEKGTNKILSLDMGTDYEIVSYSNNINKGTATAVIKGIGSYSGTKTVKFKIVGKTMAIGEKDIPWSEITSQFKSFMDGIFN